MKRTYVLIILLFTIGGLRAQFTEPGVPHSFLHKDFQHYQTVIIPSPDVSLLRKADDEQGKAGLPFRVGTCIPLQINLAEESFLQTLSDGGHILSIRIVTKKAVGTVLYYDAFKIPKEGKLYIYSSDRHTVLGAYTEISNPSGGPFATPFIPGDTLCLEYYHPDLQDATALPDIRISDLSFIYRTEGFINNSKGFGHSDWCEVNINCPEGDNWKNEKRGIARILLKAGGGTFWCTGSLVNNTTQDLSPYFLTADHCGQDASTTELNQWIFHFNYEAPGCQDPSTEPASKTMTGCQRLAGAGGSAGSITGADFFLVRLNQNVPANYNPYYNGWSLNTAPSQQGVGIHHPAGDMKKISTYIQPLFSTQWGSIPGTHWGVRWAQTTTNHGVTEQGSSGSPLFDQQKRIIGILSGGEASCSNLTSPDLYGKMLHAWDQQGTTPDKRLKDWLDPLGSGARSLPGTYGGTIYVIADFRADTTVIPVNSTISFTDLSFGDPTSWKWEFEGGNPATAEVQNPSGIRYEHTGTFTVTLTASNGETSNENVKLAYIRVIPNIYPNPVLKNSGETSFYIDFGKRDISGLELYLYDAMGRQVKFLFGSAGREGLFRIRIDEHLAGMYFLKIHAGDSWEGFKLLLSDAK